MLNRNGNLKVRYERRKGSKQRGKNKDQRDDNRCLLKSKEHERREREREREYL